MPAGPQMASRLAILAALAALFTADLSLTRAGAAAVAGLYAVPVLLSFRLSQDRHIVLVALLATLLLVAGFLSSLLAHGWDVGAPVAARGAGLAVVWLACVAILALRRDARRVPAPSAAVPPDGRPVDPADREALPLLLAAFEQAAVGLAIVGHDDRCIWVNQSMCDLLGRDRDVLRGRRLGDLPMVAADGAPIGALSAEGARAGDDAGSPVWWLCGDGQRLYATLSRIGGPAVAPAVRLLQVVDAGPFSGAGPGPGEMQAIAHLTGSVAHDFNDILQVMSISIELIEHDGETGGNLQEQLYRMLKACERGATLTRRLLAFSRRQILMPAPADINAVLDRLGGLFVGGLGSRIDLRMEPAGDLWPAMVDAGRLEEALLDLVLNAREAMPDGGAVTLRTRNRVVDADHARRSPGHFVEVSVVDTGRGIAAADLDRVCEPFFTTKRISGSGLGLSVAHGFAAQSGGFLEIASSPGQGTRVTLCLPRCAPGQDGAAPAPRLETTF